MLDAIAAQRLADPLRLLDGDGADQHRLAGLVALGDVGDQGVELGVLGLVDDIRLIGPGDGAVGGHLEHLEVIDLRELGRLGECGARHPCQLLVLAEVVLQRDGGQRLVLFLDVDALFGLDRLVQALRVAPAFEDPTGELVDDLDLAVGDQVVDVPVVERLGAQRLLQMVDEVDGGVVVHVLDAEDLLDPGHALLGGEDLALALVDLVVLVLAQPLDDPGEVAVPLGGVADATGDDQWGPGLVDEDRVDLVHDGVDVIALGQLLGRHGHVVAQVVEAELVVGSVGDVGFVGGTPLGRIVSGLDQTHRQAEEAVDAAHPVGVAAGQVIVHRDDVHTLAGQRIQVDRQGGDQSLALPSAHLGDHAAVEGARADHLHVVVTLTEHPLGGLTNHGVGLRFEHVEVLAVGEALAELHRLGGQLDVGERLGGGLEFVDSSRQLFEPLEVLAFAGAKGPGEERHESIMLSASAGSPASGVWPAGAPATRPT